MCSVCRGARRAPLQINFDGTMNQFNRLNRFSRNTRLIGWVILVLLIMAVLYAFFSSQLGQNVLLCCCGGGIVVAIAGILSERGMRRLR